VSSAGAVPNSVKDASATADSLRTALYPRRRLMWRNSVRLGAASSSDEMSSAAVGDVPARAVSSLQTEPDLLELVREFNVRQGLRAMVLSVKSLTACSGISQS
jgi:hypothetical protein